MLVRLLASHLRNRRIVRDEATRLIEAYGPMARVVAYRRALDLIDAIASDRVQLAWNVHRFVERHADRRSIRPGYGRWAMESRCEAASSAVLRRTCR